MRLSWIACFAAAAPLLAPSIAEAAPWQESGVIVRGDFDKDGNLERVIAAPQADGTKGAIYIVDEVAGTTTRWTRDQSGLVGDAAADGDFFGAALAVGFFDDDGYADLAIGVPGAGDSGESNGGAVHIVYGSSTGLTTTGDQVFHQDSSGVKGAAEIDDQFGDVLAAGDFDCDGFDDLVIGVPLEGISTASDAGAVHVLYGSSSGVSTADDIWYQGASGVNGSPEAGDHFGAALAAGNFDGDTSGGLACEDLAIGAPDEDVGSTSDAGFVYSLLGGASGLSTTGDVALHQDASGVEDTSQANDRFGLRLLVGDEDADGYDDLAVVTPGDSCITGHAEAHHVFLGTAAGLSTTGDHLECQSYRCVIDDDAGRYNCHSYSPPVYASSGSDAIAMFVGDDIVHAGAGSDTVFGGHGNDAIFGDDGADTLHGGAGLDIQIGGDGDDVFVIDQDCEVVDGEVVDGGPGDDEIHSHLTRTELLAMGLMIESADVISIPEGSGGCDPFPYEEGPFSRPRVLVTWDDLPDADSVYSTTNSTLDLTLENVSDIDVDITLSLILIVQGYATELEVAAISVDEGKSESHTVDLDDFVPGWVDISTIDTSLTELPTSAFLQVAGHIKIGTAVVETAHAPPLYGHLEDDGDTAVIYRAAAYRDTYHHGDLKAYRSQTSGYSGPRMMLGRLEARLVPPS